MDPVQKQENFVFEGHWSIFWIKIQFGIGHPPPTHQLQSTCVGEGSRVPNLQTEFNYLDSFKSYGIFGDFVVPVVPTSSLSSPHRPRVIPIAPRRSPCGLHGCGLHPMLSPVPHIVPVSSPSSSRHPHSPQKVPMWSPWLWSPLSPWSPPHVVPVVSTSSLSSPCHPCVIPVIPTSSRRSPHHPQTPRYPLHPPLPPGGGGPRISKNAIRFELIEIF